MEQAYRQKKSKNYFTLSTKRSICPDSSLCLKTHLQVHIHTLQKQDHSKYAVYNLIFKLSISQIFLLCYRRKKYYWAMHICSSVQLLSCVQLFAMPWTRSRQASLPITNSQNLLLSIDSCPLSQWCHPTVSSSVIPFSSHLQSFPASGSFTMSQFFSPGSQSIGSSASASVFLMNIQDWFLLGLTRLISLQSKGLSRAFSNTTVQKHPFFGTQFSLWYNSHIYIWLLEKP